MKNYLIGGVALIILSACATKPDSDQGLKVSTPAAQGQRPGIFEATPAPVQRPLPKVTEAAPSLNQNLDPNLPTPGSLEDFGYQSGGEPRVFFGYDQYDLSAEARDVLRRQADWLKTYDNSTVVIEGHADERGTREYNLALGARRADSVQAFLISQGVSPNRLKTISYGKERPIDGRSSESGWSRNRNGFTSLRLNGVS